MTERAVKRKLSSESTTSGLHSLLVPVDLTPSSDRALRRLSLLPLADGATVTLLHVVPGSLPLIEQRSAARDANKALVEEAWHVRKQLRKDVRVEPVVKLGTAATEIAACASEVNAEMIVIGRGGGRALRDVFLGSTAERVLRKAQRPVLVVRLSPRRAYSRPALALDLDEAAHEVVLLMLRVLPPPRPHVAVIHAVDLPSLGMIYPSLSADQAEERKDEVRASAAQELAKLLASSLARADVRPVDRPLWKTHIRHGSPRVVVEKIIKKDETDLLVLGTHAYSGAAYVLLGSAAGDLLRAAKCDVLVVPPASPRA